MTEHTTFGPRTERGRPRPWLFPAGVGVLQRVLAAATAVLLAIDAYVHFRDAHFYDSLATSTLSEGNLFRAQAVVAVVVAVALLVRPHPAVWAVAVLVAGSAVGAVLLYTYVDVGALGPLPDLYEPTWAAAGKVASAVAEGLGTLLAIIGFVVAVRTRPRAARHAQV
jgi:energy-converting hydrogenase Eha subunit C